MDYRAFTLAVLVTAAAYALTQLITRARSHMKTINGWNQFVTDAKHEPIVVPLWGKKKATVTFPSRRQMKQIFDDRANLILMPEEGEDGRKGAVLTLFGDVDGQKLIEESEDLEGAPLEHMVMTVLVEFGLLNRSVLAQFTKDDTSGDEEGGDPNPTSSSSSSTGTAVNSNGTSPNGSALTSSTTSEA